MRILAFCPTYRLERETVESLFGERELLSDIFFTADNPYPNSDYGKKNILYAYQKMRNYVLREKLDAVWIVESDIIPPKGSLKRLIDAGGDLTYGVYLFRRGSPYPVNVLRHTSGSWPDEPLSNFPEEYRYSWNRVIRCSGSGLGCVLIRREVLEKVEFRDGSSHCDTQFTQDSYRAGFRMVADMSVRCGHKLPNHNICWPTQTPGEPVWTVGQSSIRRTTMVELEPEEKEEDPTEKFEAEVSPQKGLSIGAQEKGTLKIRLNQSYHGPEIHWDPGEIHEIPRLTALRILEGGGGELMEEEEEIEEVPAPKKTKTRKSGK